MLTWLVYLLLCAVLRISNLQITLALCLLLSFFTIEYLHSIKCFLLAWAADYFPLHHMPFLSIVSYYNKLNKSKNHSSTFVYYLLFVKLNFVFTLRNSGQAKPWPTGPSATALVIGYHSINQPMLKWQKWLPKLLAKK